MAGDEPTQLQLRGPSELHTGDLRGAVDFYAHLFGWRPERIHAGKGSYLALGMGDRVGGGVVECSADQPLWLPYVEVRDVSATTDRAQGLGGEVLLGPREGPEAAQHRLDPRRGRGRLLAAEDRPALRLLRGPEDGEGPCCPRCPRIGIALTAIR